MAKTGELSWLDVPVGFTLEHISDQFAELPNRPESDAIVFFLNRLANCSLLRSTGEDKDIRFRMTEEGQAALKEDLIPEMGLIFSQSVLLREGTDMKRLRFTQEQIIGFSNEHQGGLEGVF